MRYIQSSRKDAYPGPHQASKMESVATVTNCKAVHLMYF